MKYSLLTKEQFETLHVEFAQFLATQSIDITQWDALKKENTDTAEEILKIFSDIVWDEVLSKTKYIEHYSEKIINLFKFEENSIQRIVIETNLDVNFTKEKGLQWLLKNPFDECLEIYKGKKTYSKEMNLEKFDIIQKGGSISKSDFFEYFFTIIS